MLHGARSGWHWRLLSVLGLSALGFSGCDDPIRQRDYFGEPFASFSGELVAAPAGHQPGQRFAIWWADLDGGGAGGSGKDVFAPTTFPHRFSVSVGYRPDPPNAAQDNLVPTTTGTPLALRLWAFEVRLESDYSPGAPQAGPSASLNHWIVYSAAAADILPFGTGGPSVHVNHGFNVIARTCMPGVLNRLENVPLATVIPVVPFTEDDPEAAYRVRCGVPAEGNDGRPVFRAPIVRADAGAGD